MRMVLALLVASLVAALGARHALRRRGFPRLGAALAVAIVIPFVILGGRFGVAYLPGPSVATTETLRSGLTYERVVQADPRPRVAHVVRVDLTTPGLRLAATRPDDPSAALPYRARTTSAFAAESGAIAAINGDFFDPWRPGLLFGYPGPGDPVRALGSTWNERAGLPSAHVALGPGAHVEFGAPPRAGGDVVGGLCMLVEDGATADLAPCRTKQPWEVHPRSAIGIDRTGGVLLLVVVDGRQPRYSVGAELEELAQLLVELGAERAMNLDGGGSSALIARDAGGHARSLGSPIADRVPGRERAVANHIGVFDDR